MNRDELKEKVELITSNLYCEYCEDEAECSIKCCAFSDYMRPFLALFDQQRNEDMKLITNPCPFCGSMLEASILGNEEISSFFVFVCEKCNQMIFGVAALISILLKRHRNEVLDELQDWCSSHSWRHSGESILTTNAVMNKIAELKKGK